MPYDWSFYDFTSSYDELLKRSRQPSISIHLIMSLVVEVYKCLHNIAPEYICTLFQKHNVIYELRDKNQLIQKKFKTVTYGKRSFAYWGSKLWNSVPIGIKDAISQNDFKVFKKELSHGMDHVIVHKGDRHRI